MKTRRARQQQTNTSFGLPTPAKTPKKRKVPNRQIASSAKVLFPSASSASKSTSTQHASLEEPPKTPIRKTPRASKRVGALKLDHKSDSDDIQIFTDSSARRPKADKTEDNPFLSQPGQIRSSKRKRQQMGDRTNDKSHKIDAGRTDGMYYTL